MNGLESMWLQEPIWMYQNSEPVGLGAPFLQAVPQQFFLRLNLNFNRYFSIHSKEQRAFSEYRQQNLWVHTRNSKMHRIILEKILVPISVLSAGVAKVGVPPLFPIIENYSLLSSKTRKSFRIFHYLCEVFSCTSSSLSWGSRAVSACRYRDQIADRLSRILVWNTYIRVVISTILGPFGALIIMF